MEAKSKSGTVAGAILGMAAAMLFNVLTAAPPETRTVQAAAPAAAVMPTANPADPCYDPLLAPASATVKSASSMAVRKAS